MNGTRAFSPQIVEKIVCPRNSNPDVLIQSHSFPFLLAIPSRFGTFNSFDSFNIV
jgi:hypothetical protein